MALPEDFAARVGPASLHALGRLSLLDERRGAFRCNQRAHPHDRALALVGTRPVIHPLAGYGLNLGSATAPNCSIAILSERPMATRKPCAPERAQGGTG